jgi:hypothetical protein
VALRRDESVSVVTVGTEPTPTGDPPMRRREHGATRRQYNRGY